MLLKTVCVDNLREKNNSVTQSIRYNSEFSAAQHATKIN